MRNYSFVFSQSRKENKGMKQEFDRRTQMKSNELTAGDLIMIPQIYLVERRPDPHKWP